MDIEKFSGRDNVLQYRAQLAFQKIMTDACTELGLDRFDWQIQPRGDGELAVLPTSANERMVVTRLAPTIDRLLRDHNRGMADEARIRLRIAAHEGPVHSDGACGAAGEAVLEVCRLVDSPQAKTALRRFPGTEVMLIVSDRIYRDIILHYRDLRPEHFQKVVAHLPDKDFAEIAWVYVPGENAAVAIPSDESDGGSPSQPESGPRQSERQGRQATPHVDAGHHRSPEPPLGSRGHVYHGNVANGSGVVYGDGATINLHGDQSSGWGGR
nr:hypothetical protein [Micromonospora sp. DSM 115978]